MIVYGIISIIGGIIVCFKAYKILDELKKYEFLNRQPGG